MSSLNVAGSGYVVYIRVNPEDCMAVADIVSQVGELKEGMSFSSAVSMALAVMTETLRGSGVIPKRDGFEFSEMLKPFSNKTHNKKKKLQITAAHNQRSGEVAMPVLVRPQQAATTSIPMPAVSLVSDVDMAEHVRQLKELNERKELFELKVSGVSWSSADAADWHRLYRLVYES